MKHNERARVAPQDFFKDPLRAQKKTQRAHHAHAPWLGVWFACSLWSAFSGLARSARLDPSASSLNTRGARSPTTPTSLVESAAKTRDSMFCYSVAHHLVATCKALCTLFLVFAANSFGGG